MSAIELPIVTERLRLRLFEDRDLDDLYQYHSDPDTVRYLYWEVRDHKQTWKQLMGKMRQTAADDDGHALVLAVEREQRVIGEMTLRCVSKQHRQGEIGFVFNPAYQGRGYATEAGRAVLEVGFGACGFHRIIGRCDARNTASYKLMERLGMRREAHFIENEIFKGEWGSELVYAMLAREWAAMVRLSSPRAARG